MSNYQHLLDTINPNHYDLDISIDPEKLTFNGKVSLKAVAVCDSSIIKLHQHALDITNVSVNGTEVDHSSEDENDTLKIDYKINKDDVLTIDIEYRGQITEAMNGIYPSRHLDQTIIGTQFESHHAREAFPCVDEPAAKATFTLTLSAPKDGQFLSNTLPASESTSSKMKTVRFKKTPVMSTYLLAFVWGELDSLETTTKNGTKIMSWSTPDKVGSTKFSLDIAKQSLEFFEDYFKIPYPLEHCHHIGLPDFAAGAMENWGCITYRESQFLVDDNTPTSTKKAVAITVAHEIAHQWFGNLVTMQWWTDLWLNEGFASWISVLAIDNIKPEWKVWEDFIVDDVLRAIELDSLNNTHAIEVDIDRPEEIRGIFDAISYNKGAAVIRMLNGYLGDTNFKKGLRNYMNKYAYQNATTKDLWQAIEEVNDKPVSEMMSSWTRQEGFPYLEAEYSDTLKVSQSRFSLLDNDDQSAWVVPLYDNDDSYLKQKSGTFEIDQPQKLNLDQMAPYLVSYDQNWRNQILKDISSQKLNAQDQTGFIYERFMLARAGIESTTDALDSLKSYKKISSLPVWLTIAGELGRIKKTMYSPELEININQFINELISERIDDLGYQPHNDEELKELQATIIAMSAGARNSKTLDWAKQQFNSTKDFSNLPADLRTIILSSTIRHGDQSAFDRVYQAYADTTNSQLKISYTAALTSTKDKDNINKLLSDIKTERVKLQEVGYWAAYLLRNRHSRPLAWQWLKQNWDWIVQEFGRDIMSFAYFPIYAGKSFNQQSELDDLVNFFKESHTAGIERQVQQAIEFATIQVKWRERDHQTLLKYFE